MHSSSTPNSNIGRYYVLLTTLPKKKYTCQEGPLVNWAQIHNPSLAATVCRLHIREKLQAEPSACALTPA